ncbi:platelet-activating factor acetylhydrolase 2, cytoplasmic-like isoform X2 [Acipenser oxyrinchus oxyrinchus]|uniref:Platelet-activating factor acetylhydrolase n=1 Tax=Acipenser oxyrinchus oxyrinchus TaxID=40147 RepID=A0AAD8CKB5_ACIOX|nr:platelet-activating factor acetylhydrolase 2, cytoplasmic-like isoform X2 [Acipenser oxyrinchus oxyrinchus]
MGVGQSLGLPPGSGPHQVGCTDVMTDHTREGSFFRLYYPCKPEEGVEEQPLWIPKYEYVVGMADYMSLNKRWCVPLLNLAFGSFRVPVSWNAPVIPGRRFPLIIFSHGLGAFRTLYSAVCLAMASHGFLVAAVEHRDQSACATYHYQKGPPESPHDPLHEEWVHYRRLEQGEKEFKLRNCQVHQRVEECVRALDLLSDINSGKSVPDTLQCDFDLASLKDCVDLQKVGVMGHSFGGATSLVALVKDARFRCAVALDAWMFPIENELYPQVRRPVFFINTESFQTTDSVGKMSRLLAACSPSRIITVLGTVHKSHTDFAFLTGALLSRFVEIRGRLEAEKALEITTRAALAFLHRHLDLEADFDQWDALVEGKGDDDVIPNAPSCLSSL